MKNTNMNNKNMLNEVPDDLSEAYYHLLLTEIDNMREKMQSDIINNLTKQKNNQLFRYNQALFSFVPKHALIKTSYKVNNFSTRVDLGSKYQLNDLKQGNKFTYTTQSDVVLTSLDVSELESNTDDLMVYLTSKKGVKIENAIFDLWINPEIWGKFTYNLLSFKKRLLDESKFKAIVKFVDGTIDYCDVKLTDICNGLAVNDYIKLRLFSPQFYLGMSFSITNYSFYNKPAVKNIILSIPGKFLYESGMKDVRLHDNKLFTTNIVPLFNLFDDYCVSQKIDGKYDGIPLIHPRNTSAFPLSVSQVWKNKHLYEAYSDHTVSEFYFHKLEAKLFYHSDDIVDDLVKNNSVFAKVFWTENEEHGDFIDIKPNNFVSSMVSFKLISAKKSLNIIQTPILEPVIQVLKSFSDLDIRNKESIFIVLQFLCEGLDSGEEIYSRFKNAIESIDYCSVNNTLNYVLNNRNDLHFIEYVAHIISEFFYVNSPQMIKINCLVK